MCEVSGQHTLVLESFVDRFNSVLYLWLPFIYKSRNKRLTSPNMILKAISARVLPLLSALTDMFRISCDVGPFSFTYTV